MARMRSSEKQPLFSPFKFSLDAVGGGGRGGGRGGGGYALFYNSAGKNKLRAGE